MALTLHILALLGLFILLYILGSFLWHSLRAQIKGVPPYINTYYGHRKMIREQLPMKPHASVLDLGCGDGTVLRIFTKTFKAKKAVGFDINGFSIRFGRFMNRLYGYKNITLIQDDLFNANLKGFDYIYLFLYPDFVENMEDRLFENIDKNTIIICNTFDFAKHSPYEIIRSKTGRKTLFLYKK